MNIKDSCKISTELHDILIETMESMENMISRLNSQFKNSEILNKTKVKGLTLKIHDQEKLIRKYEKERNEHIFTSSIDATKVIDTRIGEFIHEDSIMNREEFQSMKYSKVDKDLENLVAFIKLISGSNIDLKQFLERFENFDRFQKLIQTQGQSLQVSTSKAIHNLLTPVPPNMTEAGVQTKEEDIKETLRFLDKELSQAEAKVKTQENMLQRLSEKTKFLEKEKKEIMDTNFELKVFLNEMDSDLKKKNRYLFQQRNDIKMLDNLVKKVSYQTHNFGY